MLHKICLAITFVVILNFSALGQKRIIREEYLKITPYVSTLEDVTRIYGEGHHLIKGREDFLSIDYTINDNIEVSIDYFRDCNQSEKPENERTWIVEEVFFSFEHDLKLKPEDIYIDKNDFTACPYGDVVGQIIYFNEEDTIQFTFLRLADAVSDLSVMATEENKQRYKCKRDKVVFSLDPEGFRCNGPD